jgi:hypothetical protein
MDALPSDKQAISAAESPLRNVDGMALSVKMWQGVTLLSDSEQ